MKVYIDKNFMCHTEPTADYEEFDIPFFDGKCKEFVEGFRYIPSGQEWTRSDGVVFSGELLAYGKDSIDVDSAQVRYEKQLLAEYEKAFAEIEAALEVTQ